MSALNHPYRDQLQQFVQGKKILVFGVGKQGGGTHVARLLNELGAQVRITDIKSAEELGLESHEDDTIQHSLGGHSHDDILWADLIVKNPAVPFDHPLIVLALEKDIPVTTETTLALRFIRNATIGITGTRGKTTTTYLIHHIIAQSGQPTMMGGNIPQQPTLSLLETATAETQFVIEISSFHLEAMNREQLSPRFAVLTNIYPDHLNRYSSLQEYAEVKANIFKWQKGGDHAFWNGSTEWDSLVSSSIPADAIFHHVSSKDDHQKKQFTTSLPGEHNRENIQLSATVTSIFGIEETQIEKAIQTFTGVPHRLEKIETVRNISFINDTASTTPIALEKALEAVQQPFILIAGGATKHLPFSEKLLKLLRQQQHSIIWIQGSGTNEIFSALFQNEVPKSIKKVNTLDEAVTAAFQLAQAQKAKTILFSPGFTSFEMFDNEFHRGDTFKELVKNLATTQ